MINVKALKWISMRHVYLALGSPNLALLHVTKKCSVLVLGGARGGRAGARYDVDPMKTLLVTSPDLKTLGKLSNQRMHKN